MIDLIGLNRATLARQLLLRRHVMPAVQAVEHLIGLQAQAPFPPYFGLWSRLEGFTPEQLSRPLLDREVVRLIVMRGTVHLVSAADSLVLRPLTQPLLTRYFDTAYGTQLAHLDRESVLAAGRQALQDSPLTAAKLGAVLAERFPGTPAADLAQLVRFLGALVQVPPRAVWGKSGQTAYATLESWLGRPLHPSPSMADLVLRYLRAFGPATVADVQAWSGMTGLREVVDGLRPQLVSLQDAAGRELLDLPEAPRPGAETAAPVRLLAPFDNLLLSHADRSRIISDEHRKRVITINGQVLGTVLVDGFVRGSWKRDKHVVTVDMFSPVSRSQAEEIEAEALALLAFASPGVAPEVRGLG